MAEFLNDEKRQQWSDMQLNAYLAQARIDDGPLEEVMVDVPLPETFRPLDLQLHLWMSSW